MEPHDELCDRVMAEAKAAGWWPKGIPVVAAVSGGPDSMALLHMLKTMAEENPFRIVVAHANHQFRGAESDAEAEMVQRTAEQWGLPFETASLDIPAFMAETGMNAQAAAREKRYRFLMEAAHRHSCPFIVLGHHAGDQAETVLMRIIRGTGVGGLSGIPFRRREEDLELIRPLLRIYKGELLAYCKRNGVPYAVDSSNADRHYFRNAVRMDLMPLLEKYNPQLQSSLVRLADMAGADDDYLEAEALRIFRNLVIPTGGGFRLERQRFCSLHVALQRRLIKLILSYCANPRETVEFRHIEDIVSAVGPNQPAVARFDLGDGWVFNREYDEVYIGPSLPEANSYNYIVREPAGEVTIEGTGDKLVFHRIEGPCPANAGSRVDAYFDEELLAFPLAVRSRIPGDVLLPYGLNGSKKVQDMFVDAKVPRSKRDLQPLLADAHGQVLWIPGMRRSRHALVSANTERVVHITFIEAENPT
ncbi:tRNA lysidine(34) synthetase TilS [Cohnella kolymensis]|uniref:tRNA lysidine(34) synthetase TilS n=1 Tax=Cohnella kolymensis TaxID=1590652 RepID=UPI0006967E87|nr:tRNA lysidine(34) synthetase TilS [Cohnella kolymensis]